MAASASTPGVTAHPKMQAGISFKQALQQGGKFMALQQGETYHCPDPGCGCEIKVTRGAASENAGDENPRCCCGREMQPGKASQAA